MITRPLARYCEWVFNLSFQVGTYPEGSTGRSGRHYGFGVTTAWGPVRRIPDCQMMEMRIRC